MSECLPEAIRSRLPFLVQENGYGAASLNISPITSNEISCSCKITIDQVNRQPLKLFVKFLPDNISQFPKEARSFFANETIFYSEISRQLTCIPRCFAAEERFIILEDLSPYTSLKNCLELEVIRRVVEELGRFHALSFDRCPDATSRLTETLFTHHRIIVQAMHDAFRLLKKSLPEGSFYVEKFAGFLVGLVDDLTGLLQERDYKVVTHGDLWPNNVLVADKSVKFIDFQACRWASPIDDLMLLLLTALDKSTRDAHCEDLIKLYHCSFCGKLNEMGIDSIRVFPFSLFHSQLIKHAKIAMTVAVVGLPLFYVEEKLPALEGEDIVQLFARIRTKMSFQCKSKTLEIIMFCIEQGYL